MKIGFVCTNFNNTSFTRAAIASLDVNDGWDRLHVVIVDNGSTEEDVQRLRELSRDYPQVDIIFNENVGYFRGLNTGIQYLRAKFPEITHMIVGNNDLTFPPDFLRTIERCNAVFQEWAVVAPDIVTPDGQHQNPHVLFPISRARRLIWDIYHASYVGALVVGKAAALFRRFTVRREYAPGNEFYKAPGPIEQGYGACYLVGPLFFSKFSGLCAPTFLMQEEFFLDEQLKSIGQRTYYDPRFVVFHHAHATTASVPRYRRWKLEQDAYRVYKRYQNSSTTERLRLLQESIRAGASQSDTRDALAQGDSESARPAK